MVWRAKDNTEYDKMDEENDADDDDSTASSASRHSALGATAGPSRSLTAPPPPPPPQPAGRWRARSREREGGATGDPNVCPTCNGHGKVPKEKERHLVALIPADDDRLKPSRTKIHVLFAVVLSLIVAFMIIFFIYPRSFDLTSPTPEPELLPIDLNINVSSLVVDFSVRNWWILSNPNYYPITLQKLNVQAYLNKLVSETTNETAVDVSIQSHTIISQKIEIKFQDDLAYLVKFCNDPRTWVHSIYMRFQATAQVTIMGYSFTKIADSYQKVSCGPQVTTTQAPTTVTPSTTTTTSSTQTSATNRNLAEISI